MTKINPTDLLDEEVLPHRKSKDKSGKGAKTPCAENLNGNGAHTYVMVKENIIVFGGSNYTYHHKECIGCGKSLSMIWRYKGECYEERTQEYIGRDSNGRPIYRRLK